MSNSTTIVKIYYYLTPLFFLLDYVWGQSFRIAGLSDPVHRYYYYGFCILCGLICYFKPVLSYLITMMESSINIFILVLGVMLPIATIGNLEEQEIVSVGLSWQRLINFVLTGSILLYNFYSAQANIIKRPDPP
ncbi:MAG: hypothetical protein HW411_965 [Gammaproteobacteria bacterium]|nr:hypothetical protein [Gammaproteobacteria bacterium]